MVMKLGGLVIWRVRFKLIQLNMIFSHTWAWDLRLKENGVDRKKATS